jgi:hypothetical protein
MRRTNEFDRTYGGAFLTLCVTSCPSCANVGFYISRLIDLWRRRNLAAVCRTLHSVARDRSHESTELIAAMRGALDAIECGDTTSLDRFFESNK